MTTAAAIDRLVHHCVILEIIVDAGQSGLRHTYAATFLEAGGDIRLLSKALAHSSITVTEEFYAHFTTKQQDMLDQAAEKALAAMGD
jgi:site-specific recombinase XerD